MQHTMPAANPPTQQKKCGSMALKGTTDGTLSVSAKGLPVPKWFETKPRPAADRAATPLECERCDPPCSSAQSPVCVGKIHTVVLVKKSVWAHGPGKSIRSQSDGSLSKAAR